MRFGCDFEGLGVEGSSRVWGKGLGPHPRYRLRVPATPATSSIYNGRYGLRRNGIPSRMILLLLRYGNITPSGISLFPYQHRRSHRHNCALKTKHQSIPQCRIRVTIHRWETNNNSTDPNPTGVLVHSTWRLKHWSTVSLTVLGPLWTL